jgi:hypothetical protein
MTPASRALRRLLAPLGVLAAAVAGCAELGTDPQVAASLEFDELPYPAMISGDTLRDADGLAAPLRVVARNGSGAVITDPDVQYFSLDTGVTIHPGGFVTASRRDGFVRLVASVDFLQSLPRRLEVTRRPDSLDAPALRDFLVRYAIPDVASNASPDLRVTVLSDDVAGGVSPNVAGWLVRWRVVHDGDTLGPTDTLYASLLEGTRRSLLDTTGADGSSARRLRIHAERLDVLVDSFIVVAEVRRHGVLLRGSPVRFVVGIEPQ